MRAPSKLGTSQTRTNQEASRHSYGFVTRIDDGPWVVDGGEGSGVPGPSSVYGEALGQRTRTMIPGQTIYENGIGMLFSPAADDRDIALILLLAPEIPSGGAHTFVCVSSSVTVTSLTTGTALRAHAVDFTGGVAAGLDDPFGPSFADGVTYGTTIATGLTGFFWDRPSFHGGDTFTSPAGTRSSVGETTFVHAAPGAYSWTLRQRVATGISFLFLGADVEL